MLTALFLELARLRSRHLAAVPSEVPETMDNMSRMLDETIDSVHRICADLRPSVLDNLGLKEAIRWQVDEFGKRARVRTAIHMPRGQLRLPGDVSTDLFRILQEALTNIVRHACATEVRVRLKMDEKVVKLVVRDNGIGITRKNLLGSSTFGIMGMQERVARLGGEVTVRGIHGRGTTVVVCIPAPGKRGGR
jgi:signal transduction histidine kinase